MGFNRIFLGFLFFFDFRLNGFDVLPDFIGYILVFSGLGLLVEMNENFRRARSLALPLIFISLLDLVQVNGSQGIWFFSVLYTLVFTIMNMVMVYGICKGIAEKAEELGDRELSDKAMNRWTLYLIYNIVFIIGMLIPVLLVILFWIMIIFSLVTYILMLTLLKAAESRLQK